MSAALVGVGASQAPSAAAAEVRIAVASNFLEPLRRLAPAFATSSGHEVTISAGSTGKLYAQILMGAPFDVFLAANAREPARLVDEGLAVPGSQFTYARGLLIAWTAEAGRDPEADLRASAYERIAIANPKLAPYGRATLEALDALGIAATAAERTITAETVAQVLQFTLSRNVTIGFFALSQLKSLEGAERGSLWVVPETSYAAIRQDAVLLASAADNAAAEAFIAFLQQPSTRAAISELGYGSD